jgi:hypothetical protein
VLAGLSAHNQAVLTGRSFFPHLISPPFRAGLHEAFAFAIVACLLAGAASLMRGGRYADAGEESSEPAFRPGGGRHPISLQEEQHAR